MFELKKLPFLKDSLEPYISENTLDFHYNKHHQAYVNKLNELLKDKSELKNLSLEEIIIKTTNDPDLLAIFNNAAQVYNHDFFWHSLSPSKQTISEELLLKIKENFSSLDKFKEEFSQTALGQFGSGWAWLVRQENNQLSIIKTSNADNPLTKNLIPLFTIDVWEHAYYLDYQNKRADFVQNILDNLINWEFIFKNYKK
jgi:superoxide dismutase, Fe-Mn family